MKNLLLSLLLAGTSTVYAQNHANNIEVAARLGSAQKNTVLLNNAKHTIPFVNVATLKVAAVHFSFNNAAVFDSIANKYQSVTSFNADTIQHTYGFNQLHDKLKLFNTIIITLPQELDLSSQLLGFIKDIEGGTKVVLVICGNGKNLSGLKRISSPVIWCSQNNSEAASITAQVIFGGVAVSGRLKKSYSSVFKKGAGYSTTKIRLGYSVPEAALVNSDLLKSIDSIALAGIKTHSAPAIVVLCAKDGKVIFNKAYGYHTYDSQEATQLTDIFDMASVTKVTATVPSVMKLYDKKILNLDTPISKYIALTRTIPDKKDIKIREALLHEAGYTPYIKFYERLKPSDMSTDSSAAYPTKVADHYYLRANYFNEVMWPVTLRSEGNTRGKFVYSDVSMYMMKEVVEEITHQKLNDYVYQQFYRPLGMQYTGYSPRNRFDKSRIIPTTQNDNWFRNMLVQGYVNDPGAAMAGGVEGHAGLFSTANDLAIYYQMLLNKGTYGGRKYFSAATVNLFTSRQSKTSWRGLGFDRVNGKLPVENYPSQQAFGHSGYTGTYVWVDPKYNMVYICLTNRVYPDDGKTYGPSKVNIRAAVLNVFYKAIVDKSL